LIAKKVKKDFIPKLAARCPINQNHGIMNYEYILSVKNSSVKSDEFLSRRRIFITDEIFYRKGRRQEKKQYKFVLKLSRNNF